MSNPNFGFSSTGEEVASHYSSQITGKTILITGVSPGGLGFTAAKILAAHNPSLLVLSGRSLKTLKAVQVEINTAAPKCPTKLLELDLGCIRTVRAAATDFNSWVDVPKLDILINNAGIMAGGFKLNEDGVENQFATNYIGPWLFTNLIMPKMTIAKGRVVFLSSIGHMYGGVRFDDVNFKNGEEYDPDLAYGASKTANILTAQYLANRLHPQGVTSFSVHPGLILTNITRDTPASVLEAKGFLDADGNVIVPSKTLSQGVATTLVAALDDGLKERSGAYLSDCQVVGGEDPMFGEWARDENGDRAEQLWSLSERLIGENFTY